MAVPFGAVPVIVRGRHCLGARARSVPLGSSETGDPTRQRVADRIGRLDRQSGPADQSGSGAGATPYVQAG